MRKCPVCKKAIEGNAKKKYCSHRCKKAFENTKSKTPVSKQPKSPSKGTKVTQPSLERPKGLNEVAAAYWDKIAPTVISRGHLNVLSEDAFAELCDLHSRLTDINAMINVGITQQCNGCGSVIQIPGNRSLLQVDDKWDNKQGVESQSFKESALSDLKRKYSRQFLDYCKQFYLTPQSNRGNFGLVEPNEKDKDEFFG